jgi:hypothetical protein
MYNHKYRAHFALSLQTATWDLPCNAILLLHGQGMVTPGHPFSIQNVLNELPSIIQIDIFRAPAKMSAIHYGPLSPRKSMTRLFISILTDVGCLRDREDVKNGSEQLLWGRLARHIVSRVDG